MTSLSKQVRETQPYCIQWQRFFFVQHILAKSKWRKHSADYRQRKKAFTSLLTPPNSSDPSVEVLPPVSRRSEARRRSCARRRRNDKAKCYRANAELKVKLKCQVRLMEKYKKRYNRLMKRHQETKHPLHQSTSKSYLLYLSIVKNIRQRYRCAKSHSERKFIASLVARQRILKRYGISAFAQEQLKISRRHIEQKSFRNPMLKS